MKNRHIKKVPIPQPSRGEGNTAARRLDSNLRRGKHSRLRARLQLKGEGNTAAQRLGSKLRSERTTASRPKARLRIKEGR